MKRTLASLCLLSALSASGPAVAQEFYADFALVVEVPSYEAFLTNLGDAPIRVDSYRISSLSASLSVNGWDSLDSANGPAIVAALGPGADQFDVGGAVSPSQLVEFNNLGSATWQPGQSWSIGFPFHTADPEFELDPVFEFSSPDGLFLSGGTFIPGGQQTFVVATFQVVPEPTTLLLALCCIAAWRETRSRRGRVVGT